MRQHILIAVTLPLCALTAGCMPTQPVDLAAPGGSAATWQMPWQLNPISAQSAANGERTVSSFVPGTGMVRGTPESLASIGRPLPRRAGINHTVETCRATVESEAMKLGAKQVEAASAGRDHLDRKGHYVGPVLLRVTYVRPTGYEVRETTLTCIVDRAGKIVDAYAAGSRTRQASASLPAQTRT